MTERPILMNDEMVRAILAGRKTMTRRPMPLPEGEWVELRRDNDGTLRMWHQRAVTRWPMMMGTCSPFGIPGDLLYVRECWAPACDNGCCTYYRATYKGHRPPYYGWKPSIHMPKKRARIWLRVERVWVGQVQEMSDNDAHAEGFSATCREGEGLYTASMNFARVWDSIYADRGLGWDDNPWVWACEFEVMDHD